MQALNWVRWSVERTIRAGIVMISSTAVLLMASLSWKLANDASQDTLREVIAMSQETARVRIQHIVQRHVSEFEQIASSDVIVTALTDSSGREAYLTPFLEQRTRATGLSFAVFDYRGRLLIRTGDGTEIIEAPRMATTGLPAPDLDLGIGDNHLVFEAPIRFFADNKPIGYLVARIPPNLIASDADLVSSKFYSVKVNFYETPEFRQDQLHVKLLETGTKTLAASIDLTPQTTWLDQSLEKIFVLGLIATIAILMASLVVARITAHFITSPLRELTQAVKKLRGGEHIDQPAGDMPREIKTLSTALFTAFEERGAALNKLQNLAHYDNLTGTLNRAYFDHQARNMLQTSMRNRAPLTMVYIDLDRFKEINDTYGHDAGDIVLTTVTMRIQRRLRTNDLIGRRGGDEFVLLLAPLGDPGDIGSLAYDMARMIAMPVDIGGGVSVNVGVSMGVAVFPEDAETFNDLVTRADRAMYEAKKAGRGRLAFASGTIVQLLTQPWTAPADWKGSNH